MPGESNPGGGKLAEADVDQIRLRYAMGGTTQKRLGREFGVSQTMIHFIVTDKNWTHLHS